MRTFHPAAIRVCGLELDQSWWTSAYSPLPPLVPCTFVSATDGISAELLQTAVAPIADDRPTVDYGLLFCYFNDGAAFDAYVRAYTGRTVIVVGPASAHGDIVTDPRPLDVRFEAPGWRLRATLRLDEADVNVAAIYVRDATA